MQRLNLLLALMLASQISLAEMTYQERKQKEVQDLIKADKAFYVYQDKLSKKNHYCPSGYMGDYSDIKISENHTVNPKSGATCIKVEYTTKMSQNAGWCGVYWQNPPNNWGTRPGGYDLSKAKKLTFWARGEKGNEWLSEIKIGGIQGEYSDTDSTGIYDIELSKEWVQYTIDLHECDLSLIIGGYCVAMNLDNNPDGFVIYLDEIRYEF